MLIEQLQTESELLEELKKVKAENRELKRSTRFLQMRKLYQENLALAHENQILKDLINSR